MGLTPDSDHVVTFQEFVDVIIQQPVMYMDHHWRIQYYQTFQSSIEYDFVGRFEQFDQDFRKVMDRLKVDANLYYDEERRHATKAADFLQSYYTADIVEKVYRKYQIDFEYFGYDVELPTS